MAGPKHNKSHPDSPAFERTRKKIQTTQLVNRLNNYALNGVDGKTKEPIEMSSGQIRAAEILLNKSLPSLTATTIDAKVDASLTLQGRSDEELDARLAELSHKNDK